LSSSRHWATAEGGEEVAHQDSVWWGRDLDAGTVAAAVREYVQRRCAAAQVDEALDVLIPRYAGLLDRLGNA
jgi:hypothetical protein